MIVIFLPLLEVGLLGVFGKTGLVIMNPCLSWMVLISPSFLEDGLAGYSNLGWHVFSFQDLDYDIPSLHDMQGFC
jgi:hypothetical protein